MCRIVRSGEFAAGACNALWKRWSLPVVDCKSPGPGKKGQAQPVDPAKSENF